MSQLASMILNRLALGVMTLLVVSAVVFFSMALLPGDIAQQILGQAGTPDAVANIRHDLGLDRPIGERYVSWMSGVLHGDLGRSLASGRPIAEITQSRLVNTLFLAAFAALVSIPLSVGLGMVAAMYRRQPFDTAINLLTLLAISLPEFLVAYLLIYVFTVKAGWAPSLAVVGVDSPLSERVHKTVLPVLTLTLAVAAHMTRLTRAAIVNVLSSPYIEMARLKGLTAWSIIVRHALPNAVGPIVSVVVLNLAYLIVGVVVVEVIFTYPGLGQLMVDSVSKRDLPVVQASCLIFAATYITLNLLADVVAMVFDVNAWRAR
jgi:peptide/nickel transport system permease protein